MDKLELENLVETLAFYADPDTYFAIGFFPDHPSGELMDDFSETELGYKPGKRARIVLGWEPKPIRLFYAQALDIGALSEVRS